LGKPNPKLPRFFAQPQCKLLRYDGLNGPDGKMASRTQETVVTIKEDNFKEDNLAD